MIFLALEGIGKSFGEFPVLNDIDIDVQDGEFCVLVGPSGCGKSTLLRIIAGLEKPTKGKVVMEGEEVNDLRPRERNIAMVFQSYALYPHLTARRNIEFGLRIRRTPRREMDELVDRAAEILNLTNYMDRYPKQLSGGQRQRVAMGRAIVRDPRLFLFDEPLSNLDAKLRTQMRTEIRALHLRMNSTTIYVTHDQIEAMTMADKIVVMDHGRIEQIGSPLSLYDEPNNLFVASFLGSPEINRIDGVVESRSGQVYSRISNDEALALNPNLLIEEGDRITACIRPHNLEFGKREQGVRTAVSLVESTGSQTLIFGNVQGRQTCCEAGRDVQASIGAQGWLSAKPDDILVFDSRSGARIRQA